MFKKKKVVIDVNITFQFGIATFDDDLKVCVTISSISKAVTTSKSEIDIINF